MPGSAIRSLRSTEEGGIFPLIPSILQDEREEAASLIGMLWHVRE